MGSVSRPVLVLIEESTQVWGSLEVVSGIRGSMEWKNNPVSRVLFEQTIPHLKQNMHGKSAARIQLLQKS